MTLATCCLAAAFATAAVTNAPAASAQIVLQRNRHATVFLVR